MDLRLSRLLLGFALAIYSVPLAHAADQTLLGSRLAVKDPKAADATKRKLGGQAKEQASPDTIVGDPTVSGGTITFFVNGTISTEQTFDVPQGMDPNTGKMFWKQTGTGFVYKDSSGTNGAVSGVKISKSGGGTFSLKIKASGKNAPMDIVPPLLGNDGCIRFDISGGDSYHVLFPPVPDSTIKKNDAKQFDIRSATLEGLCPTPGSTTTLPGSTTTLAPTTTTLPPTTTTLAPPTTTLPPTTTTLAPTTTTLPPTTTTLAPTTTTLPPTTTTLAPPTTTTTTTTTSTTTTSTTTTTLPPITGPAFPPDGGTVGFSFSGAPSPGDPGGTTVSFTSFVPDTSWTQLYWGPSSGALPTAGLDGTPHSLTFSGISGTVATWAGTTSWTDPLDSTVYTGVPIELRVTITGLGATPWLVSTTISGLDPGPGTGIGAVADDSASALDFDANTQFVADIPTDGSGNFIALNTVQTAGGMTNSSFTGGFYSQVGP
jgi:hypothetical protein